ncbi:hypothetical protein TG4357_03613 [Thalassovita gelatinovora]|uniref:Uncharacterized protein n=1 Tax=Thalassovita gelatinovora TaxID=53501 RepID=A0A0P1G368_THAGE|nr:hypothetical protein [Thalassovita gelatinovora]QIZ82396.1 hypothetical protein HFZ77_18915 [Thalassovita gelatinovora]CUH68477.1 hypothetical protein TG4357_03613 [Thalassovita gelatinovora]SEQ53059.1 hypothetical protein SAMN04488043_10674 [Thalassovita gelatinovora]
MRNSRKGSVGQMISTLCFLGVGLRLIAEAVMTVGDPLRVFILISCAILSLSGALRFQIATMAGWFR